MHNYARLELDSTKSTIVKTSTEIYAHIILEQFHETDLIRLKKEPGYTRKAFEALQPFSGLDPDSTYQHAINKHTQQIIRSRLLRVHPCVLLATASRSKLLSFKVMKVDSETL